MTQEEKKGSRRKKKFFAAGTRACLKNVKTPNRRVFWPHVSPIFLEIHPGFRRKIVFAWGQNSSPLCILPFFKQRLDANWRSPQRTSPVFSDIAEDGVSLARWTRPAGEIKWLPSPKRRMEEGGRPYGNGIFRHTIRTSQKDGKTSNRRIFSWTFCP